MFWRVQCAPRDNGRCTVATAATDNRHASCSRRSGCGWRPKGLKKRSLPGSRFFRHERWTAGDAVAACVLAGCRGGPLEAERLEERDEASCGAGRGVWRFERGSWGMPSPLRSSSCPRRSRSPRKFLMRTGPPCPSASGRFYTGTGSAAIPERRRRSDGYAASRPSSSFRMRAIPSRTTSSRAPTPYYKPGTSLRFGCAARALRIGPHGLLRRFVFVFCLRRRLARVGAARLAQLIGEEAEPLVHLFGTVARHEFVGLGRMMANRTTMPRIWRVPCWRASELLFRARTTDVTLDHEGNGSRCTGIGRGHSSESAASATMWTRRWR